MDKEINELIKNYILCLKKTNLEFERVYLFVSYARNKKTVYSDIDLAFVFDK